MLVETVGVGQAEYDVGSATDTVLVVLCPGAGDGIQAMKAGLLEVADVLVVNKSDLAGSDRLLRDLSEATHVRFYETDGWRAPVVACSAATSFGVEGVVEAIAAHRAHLEARGLAQARLSKRAAQVAHSVCEGLAQALFDAKGWSRHVRAELARRTPPHRLVDTILQAILKGVPEAPPAPESN